MRQHWQKNSSQTCLGWAITDHETDMLLEGMNKQAEFAFYDSDSGALKICAELDEVSLQLSAQREEMREAARPVALDILASRFGLTAFERDVILLCAAPEWEPEFERLYAYVQDDATRKYATPNLALSLLGNLESLGSERVSLLPGSPLRRWRIVTAEPADLREVFSSCCLRIDERMVGFLLGINRMDYRCTKMVRTAPVLPLSAGHGDLAAQLSEWLQNQNDRKRPPLVQLIAAPDSGKLAIAQAVCAQAGLNLMILDARALQGRGLEGSDMIALLEREAALLDLLYYLDIDLLKPEETQTFRTELEYFAAPLILAGRNRLAGDAEVLAIPVARPHATEQTNLWRHALGEHGDLLNHDVEAIVEQFDFGPQGIMRAITHAENRAMFCSPARPTVSREDLWQACRQQAAPQLEPLVQRVVPCYEWDDMVVPAEVQRQLREITEQVLQRHLVYQSWGFGKKLSRGRGISALFSGASGVGKTMAAEIMARHLGLDLYRIDLAGVVSKYIGETEKNLRSVFDAAERSGAILFFDEADALFGKRSEVKDSHDRYANIEVNYLLQRMEDYRGLAILATNMKSALDSAFMRRLRFIVDFPFPDASLRREIWRRVFPAAAAVSDLDFSALSRLEIAGGNIRNIAVNAAFLAAGEGVPIAMDHVMRAARREYAKIDRLISDTEFGRFAGANSP
jgi:SpoVK/Ycf46/Vps4 family AAA+-type ATPase